MSIESWKKEFYNEKNDNRVLTKWIGCRKENLEKHKIGIDGAGDLNDGENNFFRLDGNNCDWCKIANKEYQFVFLANTTMCDYCPAIKVGQLKCISDRGPWPVWLSEFNPEPMIEWVRQALEKIEEQKRG